MKHSLSPKVLVRACKEHVVWQRLQAAPGVHQARHLVMRPVDALLHDYDLEVLNP